MILLWLILANLKMIFRNRQALFWALMFPLIFVTAFGLFRLDEPPAIDLLVIDNARDEVSESIVESLDAIENVDLRRWEGTEADARIKLTEGDAQYLFIIPESLAKRAVVNVDERPIALDFLYDRSNQTAPIVIGLVRRFTEEANRNLLQAPTLLQLAPQGVQARQLTYFDFLLPGFVAMGVMTYSIVGVASNMAVYREQKILMRIMVTPLKVRTFFGAQIVAYLALSVVQALIILGVGTSLFGGHVYGNIGWVLVLVVLGNIVFLNIGFIVGALCNTVRAADGLANAIALPMMFLSGVFFPKEGLPRSVSVIVEYLPLSPLLDSLRGVALEGKAIWAYPSELVILAAWIVLSSLLAVKLFRFN
jgi:ABC-2 type transport system permease protein